MANITYRVSNGKHCDKLESPYLAWTDISPDSSLPLSAGAEFYDVQNVPGNNNKVFICGTVIESVGEGLQGTVGNFHGIAYSLDGGITWVEPNGGNYTQLTNGQTLNKLWIVNATTIYRWDCGD